VVGFPVSVPTSLYEAVKTNANWSRTGPHRLVEDALMTTTLRVTPSWPICADPPLRRGDEESSNHSKFRDMFAVKA